MAGAKEEIMMVRAPWIRDDLKRRPSLDYADATCPDDEPRSYRHPGMVNAMQTAFSTPGARFTARQSAPRFAAM
jgi:hypothetical protein